MYRVNLIYSCIDFMLDCVGTTIYYLLFKMIV